MGFTPVEMPEGLDYLMRPVLAGLCKYESLVDGSLGLAHLAEMNDALDVQRENEARWKDAHPNG